MLTNIAVAMAIIVLASPGPSRAASPSDPWVLNAQGAASKPQEGQQGEREPYRAGADSGAERPEVVGRFVWAEHPSLRFDNIRLDFTAKFQEDFQRSYEGATAVAGLRTFEFRRSRVGIQGKLFEHIAFELERELTERDVSVAELAEGLMPKSPWKDVNVDFNFFEAARVQIGRFKIPFGLDELTPITRNDFVYRSLGAEYLAPGRDTGVMMRGRFFKRGFNYWVGGFLHDGDNARSRKIHGGNGTFAVRVTGVPFRLLSASTFDGMVVGSAYAASAVANDTFRPNGLRARTVMTEDLFFDAVYVKGMRHRWEGDLDWSLGRASIRAEYTCVTDDRLEQGFNNETLPDARYRSWYLGGTYLLTGERKTRPAIPEHAFLQGGPGAIEVAGRFERLWGDSVGGVDTPFRNPRAETIRPSGDRVVTLGANWILNRWVTVQANFIRERIEDDERNPAPAGGAFWSGVLRFQLVL
jgi:phosphate-selective porin OprO/OprP